MSLTNAKFAILCAYIAKNAAAWAGDSLVLPEDVSNEAKAEVVARFTDEMRYSLDLLDELAGRSSPSTASQPETIQG